MTESPLLTVIVSTIGREAGFLRLADSLEASPIADRLELVLIDQSPDQRCATALTDREWTFSHWSGPSPRGLSVGRNAGLRHARGAVVAFPDDDAWYPPTLLERVIAEFHAEPTMDVLCGRQITTDGRPSMLRWRRRPGRVSRLNFTRSAISSTIFMRRRTVEEVGYFDETMGVGSNGWYGAGEESDLLLRTIDSGGHVRYDPTVVVLQDDPRVQADAAFIRKMLSYGCGQGHLWRKHRLPRSQLVYYASRKVLAATLRLCRGERLLAYSDLAWVHGLIAGWRDVPPKRLTG